jgi:hypothetical protein
MDGHSANATVSIGDGVRALKEMCNNSETFRAFAIQVLDNRPAPRRVSAYVSDRGFWVPVSTTLEASRPLLTQGERE